jgi:adenylate kinase
MIRQTVLLFGPPGSGKGTQAKRLEKSLPSTHVSTGDMFRDHLSRRTELGLKVEHILKTGQLVPDAVTHELVRDRLLRPDCSLGVILDGFPRNVVQAKWLDQFLANRGYGILGVVVIEVPNPELIDRMKGRALKEGRSDDADESVIRRRIDTYTAQTTACVSHDQSAGVPIHTVNGVGSIEDVERRICQSLGVPASV